MPGEAAPAPPGAPGERSAERRARRQATARGEERRRIDFNLGFVPPPLSCCHAPESQVAA